MKNGVLGEMCWLQKTGACSQDSEDNTSRRVQPMNHHVFYLNYIISVYFRDFCVTN